MRVRTYGLVLLALVGIVPLGIYGALAIARSQNTSVEQVQRGNSNLALSVSEMIRDHVEHQQTSLAFVGAAALLAGDPELALDAFALDTRHEHLHDMAVYTLRDGQVETAVGAPPPGEATLHRELAQLAVRQRSAPLVVEQTHGSRGVGPFLTIAEPIEIAGAIRGAIVACYDLVGLWMTIASVRVAHTGFIRLISNRGHTIAHGHADERRTVFMVEQENASLLRDARAGRTARNSRGKEIVVSAAEVPGLTWRDPDYRWFVLVEQTVDEAFADIEVMKRDLVIVGVGVVLFVVAIGLIIGRNLVQALERLRAHTSQLPGNLESRLDSHSSLREIKDLADAIDRMAKDLACERDEAQRRERLAVFARVAAGLAHDLRLPIEVVRDACQAVVRAPDDAGAHDFLRKVNDREVPRLKRFVEDLQRLARRGELEVDAESTEPRALIEDVCAELTTTRKWRGVHFSCRGQAAPVLLDKGLVRRAVLNLASNAADACLAKGPGHDVALEVADTDDGAWVEFRVVDTGTGIPADRLAVLERGDFLSTKRSTGVGLGLGVVRHVAESHRGSLVMRSEPGAGSSFTLRLPRRPRGQENF